MIRKLRNKLFAENFNGKRYYCGLLPSKKDERAFELGGSIDYTPQHDVLFLPVLDVKDQAYNTCTQEAGTGTIEGNEKTILSEEMLSTLAKKLGYIQQDGYSSLELISKAICNWGICSKNLLNKNDHEMSYEAYTDVSKLTNSILEDAKLHKQASFVAMTGRTARLKSLDEGKKLYTGMDWYSGFNMSGGFSSPWIIKNFVGYKVGGHAIYINGYDLPRNLYIIQNSYGKDWGGYIDSKGVRHEGCFAIDMNFFDKYGFKTYAFVDLEENIGELLKKYEGKDVKANNPGIYRIQDGKKRAYPDKLTFYSWGGEFGANKTYVAIAQSLLDKTPTGDDMAMSESPFWEVLKDNWDTIKVLAEPANLQKVDELLKNSGLKTTPTIWDKLNSFFK